MRGAPDPVRAIETARLSAAKINAVLEAKQFSSEIGMLLAIGAACPFEFWEEKAVWLMTFHRIATLRGYYQPRPA